LEIDLDAANSRVEDKSAQLSATKETLTTSEKNLKESKEAGKRAEATIAEHTRQITVFVCVAKTCV